MSTIRTFFKTGLLGLLLLGGATLAEAQQSGNQGGQGNRVSRQASGSDGSRRNDTNYENLGALCDSLQSALNLTDIDVVPLESSGERKMKRFDEAALRQTLTEMYAALGIEAELPNRFKPSDLSDIFTVILVAAAESTPSVQTIVADGFTTSLAILRGAVTNDGNQALTAWGFKFGTDSDLGDSIHVAFGDYQSFLDTSAQDTGAFMLEKSGLDRYTTYYYAAWAENQNGIAHGDTLSFMTLPDLANGLSLDTSLVTATSATLELAISDAGGQGPDDVGFYWDDVDFTLDAFGGDSLPSDSASGTAHSVQVSGLTRMTTYYFNAYADNLAGRAWADAHFAFTTKPEVPEFDTLYADLTVDSLYALLADDGGQTPTLSRFIYSTTSNAELVTDSVDGVPNGLSFSAPIASASLLPSQDYDLNAFVENAAGRATAEASSFFTPASVFTNDSVADVTDSTASLMASFTFGNRMPDVFGFKWGLAADLSDATVSPVPLAADSTIRLDLDGLSKDSTYHFAAFADNGTVQFGDTLSFLAMTIYAPTVLADTAQLITAAGATLSGDVDDNGGADVTGFGFIWGTDASLADATEVEGDSTSATGFSKALTGLDPETTYYYAAFATNQVGTGYSDTLSFTTTPWACGDPWVYNDGTYETVEAFGDCWFAQNLATNRFANGDSIPTELSETDWEMTLDPAWTALGENAEEQAAYLETHGALYNFLAVNDARGLCPTGWHVASSQEWWDLKDSLVDPTSTSEIKSIAPAWNGTNETGLSLLPSGYYRPTVSYDYTDGELRAYTTQGYEEYANVWTASASSSGAPIAYYIGDALNGGQISHPQIGRSVRCVKGDMGQVEVLAPVIQPQHIRVDSTGATAAVVAFGITEGWDNAITQAKVRIGEDRNTTETFIASSVEADTIQIEVTDLSPGTRYWYQAIAYSGDKIGYGYWQTFTTALDVPTMGTLAATDLAPASATLNGSVDGDGGEELSATGFIWGTNASLDTTTSVAGSGTSGSFTAALTGLSPATTYYYSAFGTNSVGTAYGDTLSFDSPSSIAPEVTTSEATDIDAFTAVLNGTVGYDGGAEVTATGFVWSADSAFTTPQDLAGSAISGDFSAEITGLTVDSTYYYTAYATNAAGTSYGDTLSFTAVEPPFLCGGSGSVHYNGHSYATIHRGNQCWFTENLQSDLFTNGDPIQMVLTGWSGIGNSGTPALTPYDYDTLNVPTYGWLYNWFAVTDPRGLCPTDWHISERADWDALTSTLTASTAGASLKAKSSDPVPWNGYNSIGFTAVPAGYRKSDGIYSSLGSGAYFWTPDQYSSVSGYHSKLTTGSSTVSDTYYSKKGGMSVRCVKYYPASPPVTQELPVTNLEMFSATLNATTLANGGGSVTARGFRFGSTADLSDAVTYTGYTTGDAWYRDLTNLEAGATYYYSAYATNSYGTSYTDTLILNTVPPTAPVVETQVPAFVSRSTTTLSGEVLDNGGAAVSAHGFNWGSNADLSDATQVNDSADGAVLFGHLLEGLTSNTTYYYSAFASNTAGTGYGDTLSFTTSSTFYPGDSVTYAGYTYSTLEIGGVVWMGENLRTQVYSNGDEILSNLTIQQWHEAAYVDQVGATIVYGEGSIPCTGDCDETANLELYGRLYNFLAVTDTRGLCPTGWHVPTAADFANTKADPVLTGAGAYAWKATEPLFDGTNASGWNGVPGGVLAEDVGYNIDGNTDAAKFLSNGRSTSSTRGSWWFDESTFYSNATYGTFDKGKMLVLINNDFPYLNDWSPGNGASVRCVMDPCEDVNANDVCDFNEVAGCTDAAALNFNPSATLDDDGCIFAPFETCGDVVGNWGYGYETVAIGDQCWFTENLRTTKYTDGTAITDFVDTDLTEVALTREYPDASTTLLYGRLYNGYAVRSDQGLCPSGWHVPSGTEWTELRSFLGSGVDGQKMKSSPEDVPDWDGTNTSGFSALPTGRANEATSYYNMGNAYGYAYYWSADEQSETQQSLVYVRAGNNFASNTYLTTNQFASVRCLCDDFNDNGLCDASELQGCTIPDAENYVAGATFDDGSCTFASFATCGDVVGFDYHAYETVAIGDQCWFAENLRTTQYADGSDVVIWPSGTAGPSSPAACAYTDPGEQADYGMLYNYYATVHDAGLCPTGWHVPVDSEFQTLISFVGSDPGTKLKASASDEPSWNGTNDYGFSALPGGWSYSNPSQVGTKGEFWTSSTGLSASAPTNARMYFFYNDLPAVNPGDNHPAQGRSVRCLKD